MTTTPRTWDTFCHDRGPDELTRYAHFGDRRTVAMQDPAGIVEVTLTEDADGELMGWIPTAESEDRLILVEHHKIFSMQFPAGHQAAITAGEGEAVRLSVAPRTLHTWTTHCLDYGPNAPEGARYREFGDPRYVAMFGNQPIVEVRLTEDVDGYLRGWVETGDDRISMVEHHTIFEISFAEPLWMVEAAGQGRAYRVRLEVIS